MKIIVIGASGTIGSAVVDLLSERHTVVRVARTAGDYHADLTNPDSIRSLYEKVAPFDAVVSCAGSARFKPLEALTDDDFTASLSNKLMGQVNLVRLGQRYIQDGGSFTLTSGVLANEPMHGSAAISLVNAGLEGFARAAALELLPRKIRVNVVSPPWVSETLVAMGKEASGGMPAAEVAKAYVESVENRSKDGEVLDARKFA
ncbi:short chain dehydrogenase [Fimbriimonas ginsengisoli Gsoil 348]|uniref:Short chain dehydrogenase n=1 Tax=Fimbriimonas ginsengisoli Gsoil 348 TaxID=661478 RepID=A0A068NLD8_FIMGI|nr:short chain dehydrogenase [Fimbriimonas ginsengisoli]AIE84237.1 short chain dehydrogenase [Fimbriimonas ginsengisoli Gsoil 348]